MQTGRWHWNSPTRSPAEAPGSARRGAPGRRARARCGPSPGSHRRDAYFSQSRCRRGDPALAKEVPDPRSAEATASGSRRAAVSLSPAPCRCRPKLWPAQPRFGARDEPGKEREASLPSAPPRAPGYLQPRAPGAKSGSESWIPAPPGATLSASAAALVLQPGHQEPRPLLPWPGPRGVPWSLKPPFSPVWGPRPQPLRCRLLQHGSGSTRIPWRTSPLRCRFPRSALSKPLASSASPLPAALAGFRAPNPLTLVLARGRTASSHAEAASSRAHRVACPGPERAVPGGARRSPNTGVAPEYGSRRTVDTE